MDSFDETFVERGQALYEVGAQCINCHAGGGVGGVANFIINDQNGQFVARCRVDRAGAQQRAVPLLRGGGRLHPQLRPAGHPDGGLGRARRWAAHHPADRRDHRLPVVAAAHRRTRCAIRSTTSSRDRPGPRRASRRGEQVQRGHRGAAHRQPAVARGRDQGGRDPLQQPGAGSGIVLLCAVPRRRRRLRPGLGALRPPRVRVVRSRTSSASRIDGHRAAALRADLAGHGAGQAVLLPPPGQSRRCRAFGANPNAGQADQGVPDLGPEGMLHARPRCGRSSPTSATSPTTRR